MSTNTRAGRYVRQPSGHKAFIPSPLPPKDLDIAWDLQDLLSQADFALGRLDGVVEVIPDPDLFVFMYMRREAVLSSQIEGTYASLMDVLEFEAGAEGKEARVDIREILSYIRAMEHGLARISTLPIGRRLMCEVHAVLMKDVRGGEPAKAPGEFRRSQNWIGGASPATARFVPPPPDVVDETFARLEEFLHGPAGIHALLKIGLAHAQFETIHPFLDGNGRTGRLLITFWLVARGILRKPLLYPSLYFKVHRDEYVTRLQEIRDNGLWEEWLKFFVEGLAQTASEAADRAREILALREKDRGLIATKLGRKSGSALRLLDQLFTRPTVTVKEAKSLLDVSQPTALGIVNALAGLGLLNEITGRQRNRIFAYSRYIQLFPGAESRE